MVNSITVGNHGNDPENAGGSWGAVRSDGDSALSELVDDQSDDRWPISPELRRRMTELSVRDYAWRKRHERARRILAEREARIQAEAEARQQEPGQ